MHELQPRGHEDHRNGLLRRVKNWITDKRDELTIGTVTVALSGILGVLVTFGNVLWAIAILNVAMLAILVLQRASISDAVSRFRDIVVYELGVPWYETLYSRREQHFIKEKHILAQNLVEDVLPRIVDQILLENPHAEIRIILDSGTTITPIFGEMLAHGVADTNRRQREIEIITNNLAGIEAVQKQAVGSHRHLQERHFTLLGGTPLGTYRATTGDVTETTLKQLLTDETRTRIGIITANWLLCGRAHNVLTLCARGRGHPAFKRLVADLCDYVVIIAPLGKIFALDTIAEVEDLIAKHGGGIEAGADRYEPVVVGKTKERKERTLLVTTQRSPETGSPLCYLSQQLQTLPFHLRTNFVMERALEFSPPGSKDEIRRTDLPHLWTRKCPDVLFGEVR